jgi:hypothetical protein
MPSKEEDQVLCMSNSVTIFLHTYDLVLPKDSAPAPSAKGKVQVSNF